jgi:hypothetical protein
MTVLHPLGPAEFNAGAPVNSPTVSHLPPRVLSAAAAGAAAALALQGHAADPASPMPSSVPFARAIGSVRGSIDGIPVEEGSASSSSTDLSEGPILSPAGALHRWGNLSDSPSSSSSSPVSTVTHPSSSSPRVPASVRAMGVLNAPGTAITHGTDAVAPLGQYDSPGMQQLGSDVRRAALRRIVPPRPSTGVGSHPVRRLQETSRASLPMHSVVSGHPQLQTPPMHRYTPSFSGTYMQDAEGDADLRSRNMTPGVDTDLVTTPLQRMRLSSAVAALRALTGSTPPSSYTHLSSSSNFDLLSRKRQDPNLMLLMREGEEEEVHGEGPAEPELPIDPHEAALERRDQQMQLAAARFPPANLTPLSNLEAVDAGILLAPSAQHGELPATGLFTGLLKATTQRVISPTGVTPPHADAAAAAAASAGRSWPA